MAKKFLKSIRNCDSDDHDFSQQTTSRLHAIYVVTMLIRTPLGASGHIRVVIGPH